MQKEDVEAMVWSIKSDKTLGGVKVQLKALCEEYGLGDCEKYMDNVGKQAGQQRQRLAEDIWAKVSEARGVR